jgi:hypothetical protein
MSYAMMMMGKMRHGNGNTLHNGLFLIKYRELFVLNDLLVEDLKESSQVWSTWLG